MRLLLGPMPESLRSLVRDWASRERGLVPNPERYPPALVLRGGLGYVALLDVHGDVWIDHGDDRPPTKIPDGSHKVRCIAMGVKRRPELADWLPARTTTAVDCKWCQGSVRSDESRPACRFCSGLGWLVDPNESPLDPFERKKGGPSLALGPPPDALREFVRERLRAEGAESEPPDAVTVGFDLWVEYRLSVDGVLYAVDDSAEPVEDGPMKVYLVASIAKRWPVLRTWLPRPPVDAIPCLTCGGISGDGPPCQQCLGLSWLPRDDG